MEELNEARRQALDASHEASAQRTIANERAAQLEASRGEASAVATALGSHAPAELARLHSTTRGTFRPAIPPPRVGKKAKTSPLDRFYVWVAGW